jgi:hypothetical protein
MKSLSKERDWKNFEDIKIFSHIKNTQKPNWIVLSEMLENRSPDSCRRRWKFLESSSTATGGWGNEELKRLVKLLQRHGFRWNLISDQMPLRSSNLIKGYVYASFRQLKNKRKVIFWFLQKIIRWPTFTNLSKIIIYIFVFWSQIK